MQGLANTAVLQTELHTWEEGVRCVEYIEEEGWRRAHRRMSLLYIRFSSSRDSCGHLTYVHTEPQFPRYGS